MSDMSPNLSGISSIDIPKIMNLIKIPLYLGKKILPKNSKIVIKAFNCSDINQFLNKLNLIFKKIKIRKPSASKINSAEIYIIATKRI